MAICKWCGTRNNLNKYGFCDKCDDTIRREIKELKTQLDELKRTARHDFTADLKQQYINSSGEICVKLQSYKDRGVSFFKSDFYGHQSEVIMALGLTPELVYINEPSRPTPPRVPSLYKLLSFAVLPLITICLLVSIAQHRDTQSKLASSNFLLNAAFSRIDALTAQVESLQPKISTDTPIRLKSGNYAAGIDFPGGVYTITAVKGSGNVSSSNLFDGGINAIMGTQNDDFYIKEYQNIDLPDGTTLSIDGLEVRLVKTR